MKVVCRLQISLHFARHILQQQEVWQLSSFMEAWRNALAECGAEVRSWAVNASFSAHPSKGTLLWYNNRSAVLMMMLST